MNNKQKNVHINACHYLQHSSPYGMYNDSCRCFVLTMPTITVFLQDDDITKKAYTLGSIADRLWNCGAPAMKHVSNTSSTWCEFWNWLQVTHNCLLQWIFDWNRHNIKLLHNFGRMNYAVTPSNTKRRNVGYWLLYSSTMVKSQSIQQKILHQGNRRFIISFL